MELETHTEPIAALAFQHTGPLLASGGEDGVLALWRPGKQLGTIAVAKLGAPIAQLRWSADDEGLVVGAADGTIAAFMVK